MNEIEIKVGDKLKWSNGPLEFSGTVKAVKRVGSYGEWRDCDARDPNAKLVVTGCFGHHIPVELLQRNFPATLKVVVEAQS